MATVTPQLVKQLRQATSAGWADCKAALEATGGDLEKARDWLRTKGLAKAQTRASRTTGQGLVQAYIHHNGQVGALVEINCETDFVARTAEFRALARELAMHVAGSNPAPLYVRREEVPASELEREKKIYRAQAEEQKRPAQVIDKIIQGKVEDYYKSVVLLAQPSIKDPKKTIQNLLDEANAQMKENVTIARFARFKVGET